MDASGILAGEVGFERNVGQQVNLGEQHQLGLEEDGRILERLVFAFGGAQQNDLCVFAEVVTGRANQVADVFDDQQVEVLQLPVFKMPADHLGVEVTGTAGGDLLHRKAELGQALGIVLGLQIAGKDGDASAFIHALEGPLQQGRLARAGCTDEVDAKESELPVTLAQLLSQNLVLVEDLLFDGDSVHSSTSMYAMSSSSPLVHSVQNSPQSGHRGSKSVMWNSYAHFEQRCIRGMYSRSSTSGSHSVSFTRTSKPNWSASRSTPASSPILTPTLVMRPSGWRFASASTHSRIEVAMPSSCIPARTIVARAAPTG